MPSLNSSKRKVLLVSEGGLYLAFRLPPMFRCAGWEVDLLCVAGDPMVHSRYISTSFSEKSWADLAVRLQQILRDPHRPWQAVIVTHEQTVRGLMATGDADLLTGWQPGALNPEVRGFFLSKFAFEALHQRRHLLVPPSRICRTAAEIQDFGRETGWPVIVKPPDGSGGAGVARFNSPAELLAAALTFPILAQKYIQGRRGLAEMVCSAGRPLAWLASYSTQRKNGEYSPSTARLFCAMPELQPLVEQVAQFTQFEGFCGFDWMEDASTGQRYLIEFHPRPSSGFRFGRFCGVDFPAAVAAWLQPETVAAFPLQAQAPGRSVAAHYFSGDLFRCLRQRDWRGLQAWLPGSGACHDVFWDDLPLLAAWVTHRCRRRFSKSLSEKSK